MENEKYRQAHNLYFQTDLTQAEIANITGISTKTLYRWIRQDAWKRIKTAAQQAPAAILDRFYLQLLDLNDAICAREPGKRFPTLEEAEINKRIVWSIAKLKDRATKQDSIQVMMSYSTWLNRRDPAMARQFVASADEYLKDKMKNLRFPWELEYECGEVEDDPDVPARETENKNAPIADTPPVDTFNVEFEGFVPEAKAAELPEDSGVFCIYEAFEKGGRVACCTFLYVGEADNIKQSVTAMLPTFQWKGQPRGHTSLYFTYAKIPPADRVRIAAAIINNNVPLSNDDRYKRAFPFSDTAVNSSGEHCFIDSSFTIRQQAQVIDLPPHKPDTTGHHKTAQ